MIKNIGIDVFKINDYGIGTYLKNTIKYLQDTNGDLRYFVFCHKEDVDLIETLNPDVIPVPHENFTYSKLDMLKISRQAKRLSLDLFHSINYLTPFLNRLPLVMTVHDMLPYEFSGENAQAQKRWIIKNFEKNITRASRIIAVSKSTKSDVLKHFPLDPEKIEVIYNGVDDQFFKRIDSRVAKKYRERYQLNFPFILYAGNVRPHKNIERLIESMAELNEPPYDKYKLVIAGYDISQNKGLRRMIHKQGLQQRIRFLGFTDKVAYLYKLAEVFVIPSLYEGFGVSVLEAMAIGTPVIASNKSAIPEVAGDAAALIDPYNTVELVETIKKVISEKSLRNKLIKAGRARANEFHWEESVERLVTVYKEILLKA